MRRGIAASRVKRFLFSPFLVALATLFCLLPFFGKAFNIDDPLFYEVGRHIARAPLDPYGFGFNWYGSEQPMWTITKNPPLACYYLALAGSLLGWSETALHAAFLLPALGVTLGTRALARHFRVAANLSALLVLACPAFLVSATSVMCDVMMLAFLVWAVVCWLRALERPGVLLFVASGALLSAAVLTKYFALAMVPLLVAHAVARRASGMRWLIAPALTLLTAWAYERATAARYGIGLLSDAMAYSRVLRPAFGMTPAQNALVTLCFVGGCFLPVALLEPLHWNRSKRSLWPPAAALALSAAGTLALGRAAPSFAARTLGMTQWARPDIAAQGAIFLFLGVLALLPLAASLRVQRRDERASPVAEAASTQTHRADWLLLVGWMLLVLVFAAFLNWVINARSLLPLAPPLAIVAAARVPLWARVRRTNARFALAALPVVALPLTAALAVAVATAYGDAQSAARPRLMAQDAARDILPRAPALWAMGNWGFPFYMRQKGVPVIDARRPRLRRGDWVIEPSPMAQIDFVPTGDWPLIAQGEQRNWVPLSTMNASTGAGFYAASLGALPFSLAPTPPDIYLLHRVP